jgi:hypothetical protein
MLLRHLDRATPAAALLGLLMALPHPAAADPTPADMAYERANCHAAFLRDCEDTGSVAADAAPGPELAATIPGLVSAAMMFSWSLRRRRHG